METPTFILVVVGITILSHLILFVINHTKNSSGQPVLHKLLYYTITLTLNLTTFTIIYWLNHTPAKPLIILSYTTITILTYTIHFLFDQDYVFRFEKKISLLLSILIASFFIVLWALLML